MKYTPDILALREEYPGLFSAPPDEGVRLASFAVARLEALLVAAKRIRRSRSMHMLHAGRGAEISALLGQGRADATNNIAGYATGELGYLNGRDIAFDTPEVTDPEYGPAAEAPPRRAPVASSPFEVPFSAHTPLDEGDPEWEAAEADRP